MKVKICGITTVADALTAANFGADAIGLNLFTGPRKLSLTTADEILTALPPMVAAVALVDVSPGRIHETTASLLTKHRVSCVQAYAPGCGVSPETIAALRDIGLRVIVTATDDAASFPHVVSEYLNRCKTARPAAILVDAFDAEREGGTGRRADWESIRNARESGELADWPPLLLAGGLNPGNVAEAISIVQPWGVDVCSGVESSPGRKDAARVGAFIEAATTTR